MTTSLANGFYPLTEFFYLIVYTDTRITQNNEDCCGWRYSSPGMGNQKESPKMWLFAVSRG
jgi:hypothetical protein